jgi:RNA polymerase sigma-70 factor (ECF subfamily)
VLRERDDLRDRELFGDLAARKPEAMAALYDRHAAGLLRHGLALTRSQADAEDLVHAVFVKLATTGAELRHVTTPAAYLHRMLHTTWMDTRKRATVGERVKGQSATEATSICSAPEATIDVGRALETLPPPQREAVVLHLVEGFSFSEIGELTGVSLFTAAARYRLGLARMRAALNGVREIRYETD